MQLRIWPKLLLASLVIVGTGNGANADPVAPASAADYRQYCGQCHGADGRGQGPRALGLNPPPADLTLISRRRGGHFPATELARHIDGRAEILATGPRAMPAWGRHFSAEFGEGVVSEELAKGKLLGIVEYLRSIQR